MSDRRWLSVVALLLAGAAGALPSGARAQDSERPFVQVIPRAELGMLKPLAHTIQYGKNGSTFDYVEQGGQSILFPFARLSTELRLADRHAVIFLYQPLEIVTQVRLRQDLLFDELTFPSGTNLDLTYGFPFWRLSYLYDLLGSDSRQELAFGASLQVRNATIAFTSADGQLRRVSRDLGPVPLLKARGRYTSDSGLWLGGEVDFIYAPVKYFNGGKSDVEGALVDVSVRVGYPLREGAHAYLNVRYLAGGAEGTSRDDELVGDGFVSNWLHFLTLSLGAELQLF